MIEFALINRTSRIRDKRFADILPALQVSAEEFCRAWHIDEPVTLRFVGLREQPAAPWWKLWFKDRADEPGALGYHTVLNGIPDGMVGVEDDILSGNEISVTADHEIHETLADPFTNRMGPTIDGRRYIIETDDAVESDIFGRTLPGAQGQPVRLSDSVTPNYFIPGAPGPWDMQGHLTGGCPNMLPGGYLGWLEVTSNQWGTTMKREEDSEAYSARARRAFGRSWMRTKGDAGLLVPHPTLLRMGMPA